MMWLKLSRMQRENPKLISAHAEPPPADATEETEQQARIRAHDKWAIEEMIRRVFPAKPHLKVENCFGGDGDPHSSQGFDPHNW